MKHFDLALVLLLYFFSQECSAQAFKLIHYFKPGSKYTFEWTKNEVTGDPEKDKIKGTTNFYLSIDKEDTEGIHATWTVGPTTVTGVDEGTLSMMKEMLNINQDFSMKIILDVEGSIVGIENFDECVDHVRKIIDLVKQMMVEAPDGYDEAIARTYADPESMLASYFPEISSYFQCYGGEWENGTFWMMEEARSVPLLGVALPCQAEVVVNKVAGNKSELNITETFNREVLQSALSDFAEELKTEPAAWSSEMNDMPEMELTIVQKHVMNPKTLMVESLIMEKSIVMEGVTYKKTESFILKK